MLVKINPARIGLLSVLLILTLAACGTAASSPTPEPVIATPQPTSPPTQAPAPTATQVSLRPIQIEDAQVQIGVGSPIPVDVVASGTWPDLCAQVAQAEMRLSGTRFEIDILATPADPTCRPDLLGLSFRMDIPLNMVSLPSGTYSVAVNGVETSFEWTKGSASSTPSNGGQAGDLRPLTVEGLTVEVGWGSPGKVEVVSSGTWPEMCSQLAEVRQQQDGNRIEINLSASPANPDCPPDLVGTPFRVAVPLNMVEKPYGTYTVTVNGKETPFEWTGKSTEPQPVENFGLTLAYIGADGNLWLADASGGLPRQITSDAAPVGSGENVVTYYFPKISPDGRYIAVRRDAGKTVPEGVRYQFSLSVYDTETGKPSVVYENADSLPAGFDWKPGTHLLAYGIGATPNYFITRGKPDPALATGIFATDLDSGTSSLLVAPEKGLTLILPAWSPDGQFLSFDELVNMEGRGPFAYYDFKARQYIAWNEPLGDYDWSPDGSQLAYDKMVYTPLGTERIFTRPRQDGAEKQVSPDPEKGYAFYPVYSPDGTQIAYVTNPEGPDSFQNTLVVQDLSTGDLRELGSYESVWYLEWSSDGKALVFSAGPQDAQEVFRYDLVNGSASVLAQGSQPSLAR